MTGEPAITYRVLGPLEVSVGERPLELGGQRLRNLVAALLLAPGHAVPAGRLVDVLWSDSPPRTALAALQNLVSQLRRLIDSGAGAGSRVTYGPTGYALQVPRGTLDLHRFELLAESGRVALAAGRTEEASGLLGQALALWRGPALGGVTAEALLQVEAPRLEELRLAALEDRAEAQLVLSLHADLVVDLRALVAEQPLRERLRGQLMLALYRSGRVAEALECYRQGRILLSEELGLDPGQDLQRLERAMVARDPALDLEAATAGPAGALPAPAQLPPDVADFTGREPEVERLCGLLAEAGAAGRTAPVVVAISGQPGVGKTALAVRVAHRMREQFPNGQLHVNLRGVEREPADLFDVLGQWLRELGVAPGAIPERIEERASLYRSRLAGRRMLVLLDNAAGEGQVRPLLPASPGCAVLVTSRTRLAGLEAALFLELRVLDPDQGLALLSAMAGRRRVEAEPEAARSIVESCGRLPLALRVAGARLAGRAHWRLERLAGLLHDEWRRLDELSAGDLEVRATVALSYRALDARRRRAVRLLSLVSTAAFAPWAAAALLGEDLARTEALLDELADRHLVEHAGEDATGRPRYHFHDLVRVYAREQLEAEQPVEETLAAIGRGLSASLALVEHAWVGLGSAFILPPAPGGFPRWLPPGVDPAALVGERALDWFEAERAGLVAASVWAAGAGLTVAAWELAAALAPYFERRSRWDDWRRVQESALAAARREGDRVGEAEMLLGLGNLHHQLGNPGQAIACFRAALDIGGHRASAEALFGLGCAFWSQGRLAEAIRCQEQSLDLVRGVDELGEALVLRDLGAVQQQHGEVREGLGNLERSLAIYRRHGHRRGEAAVLYTLGINRRDAGDPEAAAWCFRDSRDLHRQVGDRRMEVYASYGLATARLAQGDLQEARVRAERARAEFERLGDRRGVSYALHCLGVTARDAGDLDGARRHLEQALTLLQGIGDRRGMAATRHELGTTYSALGLDEAALAALDAAARECERLECRLHELRARDALAAALQAAGRAAEAAAERQRASRLARTLALESGAQLPSVRLQEQRADGARLPARREPAAS